jgi:hypothetical protein
MSPVDIDAFLERASDQELRRPGTRFARAQTRAPETIDALFHLPLLALAIMTIARRKKFRTIDLGRRVAGLMVERFTALRHSPTALDRSVTLRRRCVNALVFLEILGLVTVSDDSLRFVSLTPDGKARLDKARRGEDDLSLLIRQLRDAEDKSNARFGGHER